MLGKGSSAPCRIPKLESPCANSLTLKDSYWLLPWRAFPIGPMSADQHKQIGIRRRRSNVIQYENRFLLSKNENFEKSQELKGRL
jgi:hypothetical protein